MKNARRLSLSTVLLAAALAGCKDKAPAAAGSDAASAASSSPSLAAPDGATSATSRTALDDLLHFTDARIGVSSKVDNPRDFAEHVADGRLDTAWNGKTGDLVGGWIGFRVPADTRVRLVELTVGYAAKRKGEDLFTMNHRIARVRLTRDGVSLGEHALDPDAREFQRIVVDAPGGDFKLEVMEVKPGTRAAWKELVVSELRVFGVAGAARRATATIPRVHVGSLDAPPAATAATAATARSVPPQEEEVSVTSIASPEDECRSWLGPLASAHARMVDGDATSIAPWLPPEPSCVATVEKTEGDTKLLVFKRSDMNESWFEPAIQRGGRTFLVGRRFDEQSHFDPHCTGISGGRVQSARIEGGAVIVVLYRWSVTNPFPEILEDGGLVPDSPGSSHRSIEEIRCTLGDGGAEPACRAKKLREKHGPYDTNIADGPDVVPWK